jgi:HSP20 family protein
MLTLHKPFSELLFELENDFKNGSSFDFFTPKNDVIESDKSYRIDLYVPAFKKEDFKISIEDRVLTVEGERVLDKELKYNVKESFFGKFKKTYTLPKNSDSNEVTSKYIDGVLQITIPKKETITTKLIEIK